LASAAWNGGEHRTQARVPFTFCEGTNKAPAEGTQVTCYDKCYYNDNQNNLGTSQIQLALAVDIAQPLQTSRKIKHYQSYFLSNSFLFFLFSSASFASRVGRQSVRLVSDGRYLHLELHLFHTRHGVLLQRTHRLRGLMRDVIDAGDSDCEQIIVGSSRVGSEKELLHT
jgi:hypothetical protein